MSEKSSEVTAVLNGSTNDATMSSSKNILISSSSGASSSKTLINSLIPA